MPKLFKAFATRVLSALPTRYAVAKVATNAVNKVARKLTDASYVGLQSSLHSDTNTVNFKVYLRNPKGGSFRKQLVALTMRVGYGHRNPGVLVKAERRSVGYIGGHAWLAGAVFGEAPRSNNNSRFMCLSTRNANACPHKVPASYIGWPRTACA